MNRIISALLLSLSTAVAFPVFAADVPAAAGQAQGDKAQLAPDAPDSYVVVKGDTLWGISGKFLKQPWRWPEVWRLNKDEIRNPHLIYPGQIIMLDRNGPYLSVGRRVGAGSGTNGTERLQPQVYSTAAETPIASIPMELIRQFLIDPLIEDEPDSGQKPTIVAIQDNRVLASVGDVIFAKNLPPDVDTWQIYRRAQPIKDPDTNRIIAYEALVMGSARLDSLGKGNEAAALTVLKQSNEINVGMRMTPMGKESLLTIAPHAAPEGLAGRIVSIAGGVAETGRMGVVALNIGKAHKVEPGQVYALYRHRGTVRYNLDGRNEDWKLPDERYGLVFVFRAFDKISYAIVLDSSMSVNMGDDVRAP